MVLFMTCVYSVNKHNDVRAWQQIRFEWINKLASHWLRSFLKLWSNKTLQGFSNLKIHHHHQKCQFLCCTHSLNPRLYHISLTLMGPLHGKAITEPKGSIALRLLEISLLLTPWFPKWYLLNFFAQNFASISHLSWFSLLHTIKLIIFIAVGSACTSYLHVHKCGNQLHNEKYQIYAFVQ
jgi:hypothetical protein